MIPLLSRSQGFFEVPWFPVARFKLSAKQIAGVTLCDVAGRFRHREPLILFCNIPTRCPARCSSRIKVIAA
jgi:hypothetical protein